MSFESSLLNVGAMVASGLQMRAASGVVVRAVRQGGNRRRLPAMRWNRRSDHIHIIGVSYEYRCSTVIVVKRRRERTGSRMTP